MDGQPDFRRRQGGAFFYVAGQPPRSLLCQTSLATACCASGHSRENRDRNNVDLFVSYLERQLIPPAN
jgi:hypothetical protein